MTAVALIAPRHGQLTFNRYDALESIGPSAWNNLWARAEAATVFSRYEWASAWWNSLGGGRQLRLYAAWSGTELVGLLPLAISDGRERGPAILIGDPHADYAALLIDTRHDEVFPALLEQAVTDIGTLHLREVRSDTNYATTLRGLASVPRSRWRLASSMPCPRSTLSPERTMELTNKQSLKRHSRKLAQRGRVEITHETEAERILPLMGGFFAQHIARWEGTRSPSLFLDPGDRRFYRELVQGFSGTGMLVYTEVRLDDLPVACHLGFISEGDFIWYKPSFDPKLAKLSPGEVLLRELLLYADARGLHGFDFTRGGEAFKRRFADEERRALSFTCHSGAGAAALARGRAWIRRGLGRFARTPFGARLKGWLRRDLA